MAPIATTLSELKTRAQKRADMTNSAFLSDADWTALANEGQNRLFDLLVRTHEDYFETTMSPNITTVVGTEDYALPSDFYKLLSVDCLADSSASDWYSLVPYHPQRRNAYSVQHFMNRPSFTLRGYRLVGGNLRLKPTPQAVHTVRVRYVARPDELITTTQEDLAHSLLSHWSEYIVLHMALAAMTMEESDTKEVKEGMARLERQIERAAKDRDESFALRVADVRDCSDFDDLDWPGWP